MKKLLLIAAILLAIQISYGITETKENLNINSTATVGGKTITIERALPTGIKVDVDGTGGIIQIATNGTITEINGMKIIVKDFTYIDESFSLISLEITVDYQCGDGNCNSTETNESCCTDCGCTAGICINNICAEPECKEDKDCDDNDKCTTDKCNAETGKCKSAKTTECKTGDGCCPEGCKYENDTDCEKEEAPAGECTGDSDCNDNNSCTKDKCEGNITKCTHEATAGCDYNGKCYKTNERTDKGYCTEAGMKQQKPNQEACTNDYECLENKCTKNLCGKESKKGLYIGVAVAVLTFIALILMGYSIFRKKEQPLNPNKNSDNT
jgi:hypothetical protein